MGQSENYQRDLTKTIADNAASCLFMMDDRGHATYMNSAAEKTTGFKLEQLQEKPLHDYIHHHRTDGRPYPMDECPLGQTYKVQLKIQEGKEVFIRRDGTFFPVRFSIAPVVSDGRMQGAVLEFRDVTEQLKTLEELKYSQERYQEVFENCPLPMWIVRLKDLCFIDVNANAVLHYGYSRDEFLGMDATQILAEEDVFQFRKHLETMAPQSKWSSSRARHKKKDGTLVPVEVSAQEFVLKSERVLLTTIVDVTEKVTIEKTEKELMRKLQQAKEEAERASLLKSAFLANISHEIRTPMTAVLGFTEILRESGLTEEEREDALNRIERSGRTLLKLIDDLLDISKIEAGKLTIEKREFDPRRILEDVVGLLKLQAKQKGLELAVRLTDKIPEKVYSDPDKFQQILINLIGNSIKFTSRGKVEIQVTGRCDSDQCQSSLDVFVKDSGIGLSQSDREKIFQPFSQADGSITRNFGGTGLGLFLSKRLARGLGGDLILLQSEPGEGSCFHVFVDAGPIGSGQDLF